MGFGAPVPQTLWGRSAALIYAFIAIPTHIYLVVNASTCAVAKFNAYRCPLKSKNMKTKSYKEERNTMNNKKGSLDYRYNVNPHYIERRAGWAPGADDVLNIVAMSQRAKCVSLRASSGHFVLFCRADDVLNIVAMSQRAKCVSLRASSGHFVLFCRADDVLNIVAMSQRAKCVSLRASSGHFVLRVWVNRVRRAAGKKR
ncbi:TWiK family of potassium channels protein 7, partial [Operophtera brumata]